jgi:hypothetical protein
MGEVSAPAITRQLIVITGLEFIKVAGLGRKGPGISG